jgi:Flp pilus assembly pilin Flp
MKQAQSFIEYAVVIAVVSATLIVMGLYVRRAVQGNLNIIEEQVEVKATTGPTAE